MEYYFDIETTGIDFDKDEIITIQWQQLGFDGNPIGELKILKRWECSESAILKEFAPNLRCNPWNFIFIGKNLLFDFTFLSQRLKHHNLGVFDLRCLYDRIWIDIKPLLVLMNDGRFKGYDRILPKTNLTTNKSVPQLYSEGNYSEILRHISDEAKNFIDSYQKLKQTMPQLRKHFQSLCSN